MRVAEDVVLKLRVVDTDEGWIVDVEVLVMVVTAVVVTARRVVVDVGKTEMTSSV